MKFLHTADWHIGQLFHGYERSYEHQHFLDWLIATLSSENIDVLLISGDVFDQSNPAAHYIRMFYTFLREAISQNPDLQIVITAGNHDSAARLESPKPLLESSNIHIIGLVERDTAGHIDYEKLIIPLKDKNGDTAVWCLAVPFLRMGDYPNVPQAKNSYTEGVAHFYAEIFQVANAKKTKPNQSIIALGHLHAQGADITQLDDTERPIMGGVESISATAFHQDIRYVALGHIHKAQRIGGKEHIRYSGSPIPMSFSETQYKHQVIIFDLVEDRIDGLEALEVPLAVALKRIPAKALPLDEVMATLSLLPQLGQDGSPPPYLEVNVLLDGPQPSLRHDIETAIAHKQVRLAKITRHYSQKTDTSEVDILPEEQLETLKPLEVFEKAYESKYHNPAPQKLKALFNEIVTETSQSEES